MIKRSQQAKITSGAGNGSATESKQDAQIVIANNTLTALNNKATESKQDAQIVIENNTLTFLQTTQRFNNGLTTTSFTATSIILLNTAIQTFINSNPLRRFKNISHSQNGSASFNALLIHSL